MSDNTDFVFILPVERQSANAFFFDGLDSGPDTENITITWKFIVNKNNNKIDTYSILNRNDNKAITPESYNKTPPILALITDTFGLFTSKNGGSVEYNTKESWNDLFGNRYPCIYDTLMGEYLAKYQK
jgi:hypothetical protein